MSNKELIVDDEYKMMCPECGDEWLHQVNVYVANRPEDCDSNCVRISSRGNIVSHHLDSNDIPGRRDCVEISFSCENCGDIGHRLRIQQHKGNTFIGWVNAKEKKWFAGEYLVYPYCEQS